MKQESGWRGIEVGFTSLAQRPRASYHVDLKRGQVAMDGMGLLPNYQGYLVHDPWHPYFRYEDCQHLLCNVHHLRDLIFLHEEMDRPWAKHMHDCLVDMLAQTLRAKEAQSDTLEKRDEFQLLRRY